jgi:hypothetical protein
MAYNNSKGPREFGDLKNEEDTDTQLDWDYDYIGLKTGGATRLAISGTNGYVGIGTTSPETFLHLQSGSAGTISAAGGTLLVLESSEKPRIHFQSANAYGGSLVFGSVADNDEGQIDYDNGSNRFLFKTGGSTKMAILGDNVGIGVSDPDQILEVGGAVHVSGEVSSPSAPSDGDGGILYVKSDGKLYWISNEVSETDLTSGGGGISFDGSTANGVATFKDADEATVESNLTFDGTTLKVTGITSGSSNLHIAGNSSLEGNLGVTGSIRGKELQMTSHAYNVGGSSERLIPFYNLTDNNFASTDYLQQLVAPVGGRLVRVIFRPATGQGAGSNTYIRLYKNTNTNQTLNGGTLITHEEVECSANASTSNVFNFSGSSHFAAGEIVGVSIEPQTGPGDVNVTCLWEFDFTGVT